MIYRRNDMKYIRATSDMANDVQNVLQNMKEDDHEDEE